MGGKELIWTADCLVGRYGWLVNVEGWLFEWLVGCLDWLTDKMVDYDILIYLVGWLIGCHL